MTLQILVLLIVGITAIAAVIVIVGYIYFTRWAAREKDRGQIDAELAEMLRDPKK